MRTRAVTICLIPALCLGHVLIARDGGGRAETTGRLPQATAGAMDGHVTALPPDAWSAVVRRVVDGDTVILLVRGRPVRVRLIGADAPEIWHRRDCLGAEAAHALRGLLPPGSPVRAAGDREAADRYGRRLLYLWTPGRRAGTAGAPVSVAASLIRAGLARAMYVPPNTRYAAAMYAAQSAARRARVGLWAACMVTRDAPCCTPR